MPAYLSARAQNRAQSPAGRLGRLIQTRPDDLAAITAARQDLVTARVLDVAERSLEEQGVSLRPEQVAELVTFFVGLSNDRGAA